MRHEPGLPGVGPGPALGRSADSTEHELLRPDPDAIPVVELLLPLNGTAANLKPVARPQVFDGGLLAIDGYAGVLARDQRVLDAHVARRAATDQGVTLG